MLPRGQGPTCAAPKKRAAQGATLLRLFAVCAAVLTHSTLAAGDKVSALRLSMARSLTWPSMRVCESHLHEDLHPSMGLPSNNKADSIEATVTETPVGKQRGLKRTDAADSNKITHPGTAADAKVKHVSPLADTILIVKQQERQHLLMAGMVSSSHRFGSCTHVEP